MVKAFGLFLNFLNIYAVASETTMFYFFSAIIDLWFWFLQTNANVVKGRFQVSKEMALEFAALMAQVINLFFLPSLCIMVSSFSLFVERLRSLGLRVNLKGDREGGRCVRFSIQYAVHKKNTNELQHSRCFAGFIYRSFKRGTYINISTVFFRLCLITI